MDFAQQLSFFPPVDYEEQSCVERDILMFPSKEKAVDYYFNAYRRLGYPNYELSQYDPQKELEAVRECPNVIIDGTAKQIMVGCGFLWCYFPHWIEVATYNDECLKNNWDDDKKLRRLIEKTVDWCLAYESGRMSTNRIRQLSKVYLCKQTPSNFRPTVAKDIYKKYGREGCVYDPCAGWGGRLLGFMASSCKKYVGCDPSTKTYIGLKALRGEYKDDKTVDLYCECQEDHTVEKEAYDLVFTSPPYFDCEKYSTEPTQSYIRFNSIESWRAGFLEPLIENAYKALKPNGHLVLNIANTKSAPQLEETSVELASKFGFNLEEVIKLELSSIAGNGSKYEPMFVWKK